MPIVVVNLLGKYRLKETQKKQWIEPKEHVNEEKNKKKHTERESERARGRVKTL